MKNDQHISKYAKLSKLIRTDTDEMEFLKEDDLNDIIAMIRSIENIDTTNIPTEFLFFKDELHRNIRNDEVTESDNSTMILSNAKSQNGYFVVPKVIDNN